MSGNPSAGSSSSSKSKLFGGLVALIEQVDDEKKPAADMEGGPIEVVTSGGGGGATEAGETSAVHVLDGDGNAYMPTVGTGSQPQLLHRGGDYAATDRDVTSGMAASGTASEALSTPTHQRITSTGVVEGNHSQTDHNFFPAATGIEVLPEENESAPSSSTMTLSSALKKIAGLEVTVTRLQREKLFGEEQLKDATTRLEKQGVLLEKANAMLQKLGEDRGDDGGELESDEGTTTSSIRQLDFEDTVDHIRHDVSDALDRTTRDPVARLESVVQFHLVTISALEESNALLRERLLKDELEAAKQMERIREEQKETISDLAKFESMSKLASKRQEENTLLATRITKLSNVIQQKDAELNVLREQVETVTSLLTKRDDEIEMMRETSVVTQDVKTSRFFQHLSQQSKWGQAATRAATFVDRFSVLTGGFLKKNAPLRIFIALYLVVLHLYVFHVVTSIVHLMPHGVGDDAHDHIENHLHPGK